jgi:hypothetical protein
MIGSRTRVDFGPDFLCIGAQKAGTGWLYDQLGAHPETWMPLFKELHYFDRRFRPERMQAALEGRERRGRRPADGRDRAFLEHAVTYVSDTVDFDWYRRLFAPKGHSVSGDVTPAYSTLSGDMVGAIADGFPGTRIVLLVRDPIERVWSQLAMEMRRRSGRVGSDIADWQSLQEIVVSPVFAGRSFPALTARTWRRHFGHERVFIGFFDDLQARPEWLRARAFEFIGIAPDGVSAEQPADHNPKAGVWKPTMTSAIRESLASHFRDELHRCADELGGPARSWPARYGL